MNTLQLFRNIGIEKINPSKMEWQKVKCPKCSHTHSSGKRNQKDLSIKLQDGAYKCHRPSCDFEGNIMIENKDDKYERPKHETYELLPEVKEWLEKRELSIEAAEMFKVGSKKHQGRTLVFFNYYNLYGRHCNIKARDINDKSYMRQSPGAEKTPYGAQFVKNAPYIVITEGEPDVLAWATAGVHYAISGNNGSSDDSWIETIYEQTQDIEKIYIAVDNDEAGKKYAKNLERRFPKEKLYLINYGAYNDANDVLIQNGKEEGSSILKYIFNNAEPVPVPEIEKVEKHMEDAMNFFINGYPETYKLGIQGLDDHWSFYTKDVTLVSGTPNAGKSNFVDWVVTRLAKLHGLKSGIFTGEKSINVHLAGLAYKWIERSRDVMIPTEKADQQQFFDALAALNKKVYYFNEDISKIDDLIEYGTMMVHRYGINCLVLDNWTVIDKSIPKGENSGDYFGTLLGRLAKFAKKNDCGVILVAHPRKLEEVNGVHKIPTGYDIYGTSHFYNQVDNGISFRADNGFTDYHVWKIRHQEFVGYPDFGKINFDKDKGGTYSSFGHSGGRFDDYIKSQEIDDTPF